MHTHKTLEQIQVDIASQVRRANRKRKVSSRWEVRTTKPPITYTRFRTWESALEYRNAVGGEILEVRA